MSEQLPAVIAPWLSKQLGVEITSISNFRRHTEGFSWQTYTFEAHWLEANGNARSRGIAIRRQPEDGLLAPYDIAGQYRLHQVLTDTVIPVPGLIALELDHQLLGMPFYAMDRVEGVVPVQWQAKDPAIFPNESIRHQIGIDFIDNLTNIHQIDWQAAELDVLLPGPGPLDPATAEINRWEKFLDGATLVELPLLRAAINWCRQNRATSGHITLCHGDYRIGNFMLSDHKINAVFDWELAHIGDPIEDLAWAGLRLFRGRSPLVSNLLPLDMARARYTERTGIQVDDDVLRFWTVLGMIRAAAPHLRAATAFESKKSSDLRLAAMGHQVLHVLRHIADELGWNESLSEAS